MHDARCARLLVVCIRITERATTNKIYHFKGSNMDMDTTTDDDNDNTIAGATTNSTAHVQGLQQQLEAMIAERDWDGICGMIQEQQADAKAKANDNDDIKEMKRILISNRSLSYELLKDRDSQPAKALLLILVVSGDKDYIMKSDLYLGEDEDGEELYGTLLHGAAIYNSCMEIVSRLIELGGRDLIVKKDDRDGWTSLHWACYKNASIEVVRELIKVGGRDFIFIKGEDEDGSTSSHCACKGTASIEVVKELIEEAGRELVFMKNNYDQNSLQVACEKNTPIDIVRELLKVGGQELVWEKNMFGATSLHCAFQGEEGASIDVVKELIREGGRDLVWEPNEHDQNALHAACECNAPVDVVKELIEAGGPGLGLEKDNYHMNSLHWAANNNASIGVFDLLIQHGGRDILTQVEIEDKTPLHYLVTQKIWLVSDEDQFRSRVEKISYLIIKGTELQIGGEYSIGGLLSSDNTNQEVEDDIYNNWIWNGRVLPALEQVIAMPNNQRLPILQALIVNKAPAGIIASTVNTFTDSINTRDSFDKYPLDFAIDHGLSWDDGLEHIIGALASVQQTAVVNICAKYGIQWENGMKSALKNSNVDILETADTLTGLYLFMVAAVGSCEHGYEYDFDSVYHLIKSGPLVVRQFSADEEFSRKRKRG